MKKIITLVSVVLFLQSVNAQNVGIGTNSPGTKLDVSGAITLRETSLAISANAATIPSNVSQVRLTGAASATVTVTPPAAPPNAGQVLVIYNNTTGGFSASFASTTIPNGTALQFVYSNSAWVASSSPATGSGNYIQNNTTVQSPADFNVSGTGTVGTVFTAPTVQGSTAASGTLTLRGTSSGTKPTAGILLTDNIASTSTTTGTAVITGGEGISGNLNVGGNTAISGTATVTGVTKLSTYPSGIIATDATGTLTTPRTITGTASQIDVTNGTGVSGNPTININTAYTTALKSPFTLTGGGNFSYISGNFAWSNRFIVICNGNGSQFSTNGFFDMSMPTSGTITGVGGAGSVTATGSGIPLAGWQALYYILPIGSANPSVAANFRIVGYTTAFAIPETWVLVATVNGDDNTARTGSGTIIQPGQTWAGGVGIAQNSGASGYIQNGTSAQSANFNITGAGTIGSTVKFSAYTSGFLATDGSGTLTAPRSIAVSGTGIAVTNGNGVSGNPTLNLNYGTSVATAAAGQFPVGNFGQFENHGTYTDFNTTPNYWGWNYVQGNANGPNTTSAQWYREISGLGANYPGRGAGSYSLELAYPRNSPAAAGMWMRVMEGGTYGSWVRMDANGISAVSSSLHPSMDDVTGWTNILTSCADDNGGVVNWGFPVLIDGVSYTSGWISTNGVLGFGTNPAYSGFAAYSNTALPGSLSVDPMLFFHWDDDGADLIRYVVQGTAPNRNCFIHWQGSEATGCGGGASRVLAYITISEGSNVVSVRYLSQGSNADAQGAGATFGFQYAGGSSARTVPMGYNTKMLDDNASNQSFSIDLQ